MFAKKNGMGTVQRTGAHAQLPARQKSLLLAALRQASLRLDGLTAGPLLRRIPAVPHGGGRAQCFPAGQVAINTRGLYPNALYPDGGFSP